MSHGSLGAKVKAGVLWSALQNWGVKFSGLLLFVFVARWLTPEEIGIFSAAAVVLGFFTLLSEQGLSEAIVQRAQITREQVTAVFWINLLVAVALCISVVVYADDIARLLETPAVAPYLSIGCLALPLAAASFGQLAMHRRTFGYRWIAQSTLVATVIGGLLMIVLAYLGYGTWSLVAQTVCVAGVTTVMLWIKPVWVPSLRPSFDGAGALFGFGIQRLGTSLLEFANTRYIEIFLVATFGPAALATYAVGMKLHMALMQMLSSTVLDVAHSGFSRLAPDGEALLEAYYKSVRLTATLAVPVFVYVIAMAPLLTEIIFGDRWRGSAPVMMWMGFLGAVQVLQFYNGVIYNAMGRPSITLGLVMTKLAVTLVALVGFGDHAEMLDLLILFVAAQLSITPLNFWLVRILAGVSIRVLLLTIGPMLLASAVMGLCCVMMVKFVLPLSESHVVFLLLATIVAAAIYLGLLWITAPSVIAELNRLLPRRAATSRTFSGSAG